MPSGSERAGVNSRQVLRMFLSFFDDSESSSDGLSGGRFQVVGGPIINDIDYGLTEFALNLGAHCVLVENFQSFKEFHACKLFHAAPPYNVLDVETCRLLFDIVVRFIQEKQLPIVYGAVNVSTLMESIAQDARPIDVAFQKYFRSLERWMKQGEADWTGVMIGDDSGESKRSNRKIITESFYKLRKTPKEQMSSSSTMSSQRLLDDIYFSDSRRCIGVQLADVCVYLVSCHLSGNKTEQEPFYDRIKHLIFEHDYSEEVIL
ncbi:MAG TPA: DUF3800 domain-containing protein [Terriglobia bacterium]|nr:DUF3800 domain-containing protein [Terriglobia bacterium]